MYFLYSFICIRIFPQIYLQVLTVAVTSVRLVSICKLKTLHWAVRGVLPEIEQTQQKYVTLIFKECFNLMLLLYLRIIPELLWFVKFVFCPKDLPLKNSIKKIILFLSQQLLHFNTNILSKEWWSSWFYIPENADLPEQIENYMLLQDPF